MRRRLTPEEIRRMVKMYREGRPVKEIAFLHNVTDKALYRALKRSGVAPDRVRRLSL
jgi:transposase-like protein